MKELVRRVCMNEEYLEVSENEGYYYDHNEIVGRYLVKAKTEIGDK